MSCEYAATELTDKQKADICGILSVGCDRQTAADFVGCTLAAIRRQLQRDPSFLAEVCRTEAAIEVSHMRTVQEVSKEKKEWRAAVWWLERHAPERFARRAPGEITAQQLNAYTELLADALHTDVHNDADRERITVRLQTLASGVARLLRDARASASELAEPFAESDSDVGPLLDFDGAE